MSIRSEFTTESKARMNGDNKPNAFHKNNLSMNNADNYNQSNRIKEKKPITGKITSNKN